MCEHLAHILLTVALGLWEGLMFLRLKIPKPSLWPGTSRCASLQERVREACGELGGTLPGKGPHSDQGARARLWRSSRGLMCPGIQRKLVQIQISLPCISNGKESACDAGDQGAILGWDAPLEKGMAIHSRILAWRIPWTQATSPWGRRVGHNWATHTHTHPPRSLLSQPLCSWLLPGLL